MESNPDAEGNLEMDNVDVPFPFPDMDEEGMVNFLTDAIGQDVGAELLKEFTQSNAFAELLDVVTASLGAQHSCHEPQPRNNDDGDPPAPAAQIVTNAEQTTAGAEFTFADKEKGTDKSVVDSSDLKINDSSVLTDNVKIRSTNSETPKQTAENSNKSSSHVVQTAQNEIIAGSFEDSIKVMDKISSHVKLKYKPSGREHSTGKEDEAKGESIMLEADTTGKAKSEKDVVKPNSHKNLDTSSSQKVDKKHHTKSDKDKKRKLAKIRLPNMGGDFLKYKRRYRLKVCSVILCDILKLGDMFQSLRPKYLESKRPIVINRLKIKEIQREERIKRQHFKKRLKLAKPDGERRLTDTDTNQRVSKGDHHSSGNRTTDEKKRLEGNNEGREMERHKKRKEEKFSAGGTRILPFEKRRIDDRDRIKRPKMKDLKPEKPKEAKDLKSANQLRAELERQKLNNTFRIPKRNEDLGKNHRMINNTPLRRHEQIQKIQFERRRLEKMQPENQLKSYEEEQEARQTAEADKDYGADLPEDRSNEDGDDEHGGSPPPPITEVELGQVALGVTKLLGNSISSLLLLDEPKSLAETTAQKCAWWFRTIEKDVTSPALYNAEEEEKVLLLCGDDSGSEISFIGNVSNPGGIEDLQINEISSTGDDVRDEYCGCGLLNAKYRTTSTGDFKNIFFLRPGTNYDKENFQANCNICNELIVGKRQLASHVGSLSHLDNLQNLCKKKKCFSHEYPYQVKTFLL